MITKKELRETLEDIRERLECYNISIEEAYSELYNVAMDYDYNLEDIFEDYITEETAEEMAKHELEEGGLERLYFFLGDINPCCHDLFRINGYGNLEEVDYSIIWLIIDEIEDRIGTDEEESEED